MQPTGSLTGPCRSARTGAELGEMTVGPGTLAVRVGAGRPAQLRLRRFGSYRFLRYDLKGGTTLAMQLPRDRSRLPWRARLVGGEAVRVCGARSGER